MMMIETVGELLGAVGMPSSCRKKVLEHDPEGGLFSCTLNSACGKTAQRFIDAAEAFLLQFRHADEKQEEVVWDIVLNGCMDSYYG